MLATNTYPKSYIDHCRRMVDAQLAAYRQLRDCSRAAAGVEEADYRRAQAAFESPFCTHLVLALDLCFVHRTRALEGKDGNPLNEVRMLCHGILRNKGVMPGDKTIKYDPQKAVLGIAVGETIAIDEPALARLSRAFFAEITARYRESA